MDNIEFLLQSLETETDENATSKTDKKKVDIDSLVPSHNAVKSCSADLSPCAVKQVELTESKFKNDYDFAVTKKQISSQYSRSGYEIHKKLKENEKSRYDDNTEIRSSKWNTNRNQEKGELVVISSTIKSDVYAEPVFGLRLINPVVSSSFIESKMTGRHPVPVSNISYHLRCGDKSKDWVFAGAIVFKSGLKTSQKGSQYCLWKISDLKQDLKQVTLYLFGKACSDLWKVSLGTVAAVLNATPFYKDEKPSNDEVTLTIKSVDQVMIWGGSRDYGLCKALKKNGERCTSFVNKSQCEFCVYHVKKEYNKYAGTRSNLQAPSMSLTNLRNKVLGKSEVFYAGKSYSALNTPKRSNGKKEMFTANSIHSGVSKKIKELDQRKLDKLDFSKSQPINNAVIEEPKQENFTKKSEISTSVTDDIRKSKTISLAKEEVQQKEVRSCTIASPSPQSSTTKPVSSRLHLLKQAGAKMLESGEVTRVTAVTKKKTPYLSFADVLTDHSSPSTSLNTRNPKEKETKDKKITLNNKESFIDFSVDMKFLKSDNLSVISKESNTTAVNKMNKNTEYTKKITISKEVSVVSSRILQDFKNLTNKNAATKECVTKSDESQTDLKAPEIKYNKTQINSMDKNEIGDKLASRMLMLHQSSPSTSIHDLKRARAKQNAINLIRKQGGITKTNPNQIRSNPNKQKSLKRPADSSDTEDVEECLEKSVLSQRFVDLMNASSRHENLVQIAEDRERQDYFNKMEKKEQLEEKMLSTYKVPCKAVVCLKCKYKWFSASDLCRVEGHPIKVIDTVKRYFKCDNCTNRTISLELVPLISCKQCGSSKWSRAGMIKEKLAKIDNMLSIRGDEIKHLDSLSHSMNINLLVPADK